MIRRPALLPLLAVALFVTLLPVADAATPTKLTLKSDLLQRDVAFSLMTPDSYAAEPERRYPVIYVLDGWGGNGFGLLFNNAIGQHDFIRRFVEEHQVIVVNLGIGADWYFDSPMDATIRWGSLVTGELIKHVDANWRTIAAREGRAITGFSSGGHGALLLAFQNPTLYAAAGSVFGCPDLERYIGSRPDWKLPHVLGPHATHAANWVKYSLSPYLANLKDAKLGIWFGCGTEDELSPDNRKLHQQLTDLGVEHTYHEAPGGHNTRYADPGFKECLNALIRHLK